MSPQGKDSKEYAGSSRRCWEQQGIVNLMCDFTRKQDSRRNCKPVRFDNVHELRFFNDI